MTEKRNLPAGDTDAHAESGHWPLFDAFPALQAALSPVALTSGPTPVEPVTAFGPLAWIKRDDLTHPVYARKR